MIDDERLPLALLLAISPDRYGSGPRFTCHPVRIDTGPLGANYPRGMVDEPLDGLTVSAYMDTDKPDDNGRARSWGWSVEYRDLHAVDLRRAETMTRTLRAIDARMSRITARYGPPVTFGAYLLRVADALHIDRYITRADPDAPNPSATYSAVEWTTTDAAGADAWTLAALRRAMHARG